VKVMCFASHLPGLSAFALVAANHMMGEILVQVFAPGIRTFVAAGSLYICPNRALICFGHSTDEALRPSTLDCDRVGHYRPGQSLSSKGNQLRALRFRSLGRSVD
jgi:hypothetical protein